MRTRLDEIVEEAFRTWYGSGGPLPTEARFTFDVVTRVAKNAAERAFRHGVERHTMNPVRAEDAGVVRPAPAEEKPCPYCVDDGPEGNPCLQHLPVVFGKSTATASDDTKDRFPIRYDWKYMGGPLVTPAEEKTAVSGSIRVYKNKDGFLCPDYRKGERRKGLEICPHAPEYPGRCFVYTKLGGTVLHAGDSRHKDRRK